MRHFTSATPWPLAITTLLIAALACTTVTSIFTEQPSTIESPAGTASEVGPQWPEDALPPLSPEEVLDAGIEQGVWTEGEGLVLFLQIMTGEREGAQIHALDKVVFPEWTTIGRRARHYLEQEPDPKLEDELQNLLDRLLPERDILLQYSIPESEAGNLGAAGLAARRPSVQGDINCRGLWEEGLPLPGQADEDLACFLVKSFTLDNRGFEIYYPIEWRGDTEKEAYAEAAAAALEASYREFSQHGHMVGMTLIFPPDPAPGAEGKKGVTRIDFNINGYAGCPVVMYPPSLGEGADHLQWVIAHEAFHCFQASALAVSLADYNLGNMWWTESSAVYFSNVVYPCVNYEHEMFLEQVVDRSRHTPIFEMKYEAYVLFQHIANIGGGPAAVAGLLESIPTGGTLPDAVQALATAGIDEAGFHQFGQRFLDGRIADSCGGQIALPSDPPLNEQFVPSPPGDFGPETLGARPYTVARYGLVVPDQARYLIELAERSGRGSTATRAKDAPGAWGEMPDDVRTSCDSDKAFLTLLTSTDLNSGAFELSLKGEGERAQCDGCLLGTWESDRAEFQDYMQRAMNQHEEESIRFLVDDVHGNLFLDFDDQRQMRGASQDLSLTVSVESAVLGSSLFSVDMNITMTGEAKYTADGEVLTLYNPEARSREEGLAHLLDGSTRQVNLDLTLAELFGFANAFGADVGPPPEQTERRYQCLDDQDRLIFDLDELGKIEYRRSDENLFEDQ